MACKEREVQSLRERVIELERQLAEAQAAIQAFISSHEDALQSTATPPQPQQQAKIDPESPIIDEASVRRVIFVTPHPLMIRRDDGYVVMINKAWTDITGYTLEDIPTTAEWTRKAYGERAPQAQSLIINEGFSQTGIKNWGEFEVTIRSGEKRIWDFSSAPLGFDNKQRELVMAMAVDITERKQAEAELRAARDEAARLARFPAENPNPVLRVSNEGMVLYCNPPAASLRGWRCAVDAALSRPLLDLVELAVEQNQPVEQDVLLGEKSYSVSVIPFPKQGYLNLYGKDITERKQAEKALAEIERRQREITRLLEVDQARLAAILQHLPVGVWIADQTGRLIGSNQEADRIWGGESPLVNSPAEYGRYQSWNSESGKPLEIEEYPLAIALQTGQPVEPVELKIRRFDGSEGTILCSAAPIKDRQGLLTGAVGVNLDITDRKIASDALQESEVRFAKAFRSSPDAMAISRLSDTLLIDVNEGWTKLFGYDRSDVLTRTIIELGVYVDLEDHEKVVTHLQEMGSLSNFEVKIQQKSGEIRQVSLSAEKIEILGVDCLLIVFRDITEQKQAEQALQESEQRLKRAQEIAQLGSWELDVVNDRLTWSDEVYRIFGLEPQKFNATYEAFLEAVHSEDRAAVDNAYSSSIREGRDTYEIEHRVIKRSNGEVRIVHEKCEHLRDQNGNILRSIGMVHDITERKQAEEQLKIYADRLEHSNRELEQFAFMASHDLQEPLRKIEMFGDLLLERATHLDEQEHIYIDRMRKSAERMRDMVEGLLQLSRVSTQGRPFMPVDLSQLTSEVLSDLEDLVRRTNGRIEVESLPTIEGDALQLRQLMQNLIGNALKYHQPGNPPQIHVSARQLSERVQILVEDQGIGFAQEDAERIFKPFKRLVGRSQYEGSGIGLAICRRIVERHRGEIAAMSEPGQGTTFIVTLPIHQLQVQGMS